MVVSGVACSNIVCKIINQLHFFRAMRMPKVGFGTLRKFNARISGLGLKRVWYLVCENMQSSSKVSLGVRIILTIDWKSFRKPHKYFFFLNNLFNIIQNLS